uniref:ATP synthase F0 subunit 8 n=1 Tax=Scydmaeninae sp. 840218 TaxID=1213605 RepID=A0A0S2MP77_9COLE|nr:ATP synthase F0 subunit 8 [Scydmaeninae sp. 840218]
MPQMSPMNWMILFMIFMMMMLIINIINFFSSKMFIKKIISNNKIYKMNWKW